MLTIMIFILNSNWYFGSYFNSNLYKYLLMNIVMKVVDKDLLKLIKDERIVTSSEVADKFSVSWNTAEKYLMELLISGKVDRIKKVGVTLWVLR